jgi:hypothetical protein
MKEFPVDQPHICAAFLHKSVVSFTFNFPTYPVTSEALEIANTIAHVYVDICICIYNYIHMQHAYLHINKHIHKYI